MTPFIAELLGTMILILLGCGVVANVILEGTKGQNSGWIVITTGWALAVYVGVVVAAPYSGAHINPAVSIALAVAGQFPWESVPSYILAQFIGAMLGSGIIWVTYKKHFDLTGDANVKLGVFCTAPAIRHKGYNLLSEAVGTFVLLFAVLFFTDASITESDTAIGLGSLGAIPVAFTVWAIGLCLGGTTGYAINPARDLGPRIMHALLPVAKKRDSDWSYSWIPVLGPIAGGIAASWLALAFI